MAKDKYKALYVLKGRNIILSREGLFSSKGFMEGRI